MAAIAAVAALTGLAGCGAMGAATGSGAACAVSYADMGETAQDYVDADRPGLIARATLGKPHMEENRTEFTARLIEVRHGDAQAGDDVDVGFACDTVAAFMPDGYRTGDELIIMVDGGTLRHPHAVWRYDATTWAALSVPSS